MLEDFYALWDLVPLLLFTHPDVPRGINDAGVIQVGWFEFDDAGLGFTVMVDSIATGRAERGVSDVSAVRDTAPACQRAVETDVLFFYERGDTECAGGEFLTFAAVTGYNRLWSSKKLIAYAATLAGAGNGVFNVSYGLILQADWRVGFELSASCLNDPVASVSVQIAIFARIDCHQCNPIQRR